MISEMYEPLALRNRLKIRLFAYIRLIFRSEIRRRSLSLAHKYASFR